MKPLVATPFASVICSGRVVNSVPSVDTFIGVKNDVWNSINCSVKSSLVLNTSTAGLPNPVW